MARSSFFEVEAMIRGYHEYKAIWEADVGKTLQCQRQTGNPHDAYAVAVLESGVVVGHVPKKISCVCSLFLRRRGAISCTVTGDRRYSADLEQGGLEVPCILKFKVDDGESLQILLYKTHKLVRSALFKDSIPSVNLTLKPEPHHNEESKSSSNRSEDLAEWQRDILKGEKLSDVPINIAQRLLKTQFPHFGGLQSTLYQQKHRDALAPKSETLTARDQLQIIHCRDDHWIAASTVGCKDSVNIYDSVYTSVDDATEALVPYLFHTEAINVKHLQRQVGGADCGLFAIAVITAIAHGLDPSKLKFKQEQMRDHLLSCYEHKQLTLFPYIES
jgi:hypothetical protein